MIFFGPSGLSAGTLFRRILAASALLASMTFLGGCETSPATGESFFTGGLTKDKEASLGAQEHKKILQQFGGAYADPEISQYVTSLGNLLAKTSETPDQKFTFTVLDSPVVNAFALPGGYVYITRGLMALADDEAELAGVMAHEIGHVTARHASQRYGRATATSILAAGVGILLGSQEAASAAGQVGALALQSYSRDQEFQADLLGVRYLSRAGFEPEGMADFLTKLQADSRLNATIAGNPEAADSFDIMQTHPRTTDRIKRAIDQAGEKRVKDPVVGRQVYLSKIDGLLYGDDPKQGIIQGRKFLHPELRLAFEVPKGFRLVNTANAVGAQHKDGSVIIFDRASKKANGNLQAALTEVTGKVRLENVERITINGMESLTGQARVNRKQGPRDVRLIAMGYDQNTVYRFLFSTPAKATGQQAEGLRRTTYSFRKLSAGEAGKIKPKRIRLHKVRAGDTAAKLAGRFPYEDYQLERFQALNGLGAKQKLKSGQTVKIITQ
ncbi:M48 family metalloprotease [Pelagibius sp. Alg239-R121]|uniref:M48 family metalloprotease n=1 Tax=Pelagibius sp. Alg239-R121 TaxID=2993448 RepID=UPI0024A665D6|nr:M48 family metalloprotease [Pelagibius sp. Alg239-R121]